MLFVLTLSTAHFRIYNLINIFFRLAVFFQIYDDVRNRTQKKLPMKSQWKSIVGDFHRGIQYERLEGQEGRQFSATKINFETPPAGGGARG